MRRGLWGPRCAERLILVAALVLSSSSALAQTRVHFDLPAQPLAKALRAIGIQTNTDIIVSAPRVAGLQAPALQADLTAEGALERVLAGSGLEPRYVNDHTIAVVDPKDTASSGGPISSIGQPVSQQLGQAAGQQKEGKSDSSAPFRLAQANQGKNPDAASLTGAVAGSQDSSAGPIKLEEVVVTAQKRAERLQEVPVPVTALSADMLLEQNQLRLQDYYASVPGLSLASNGHGDASLSIRGVTTGGLTNPTVGITIDDVPFGSTTALGSRTAAPDLDPSDLARIEVLRGPQGTLYGASSMGGLLKYVTADPSTAGWSGRVQGEINGVHDGDGVGYGVRGAVNIPVSDTLAVRMSAFTRRDPGYINDPTLEVNGINQVNASGGHVSALWRPSADWSLKLSALLQDTSSNGAPYSTPQPGLSALEQIRLSGTGEFKHEVRAYSATVTGRLGDVDLVFMSGYGTDKYTGTNDLTAIYGITGFQVTNALFGVSGATETQYAQTKKFTEELRLSGSLLERVDWLGGLFYTHEDTPTHDRYYAVDSTTLAVAGLMLDDPYPTTYEEYAAFGDLTVRVTDRFDIQFGGREGANRQTYVEPLSGILVGGTPVSPPEDTKDNSFTYLLTPRFRFSSDLMAYARFASGYRPGGPNPTCKLYPVPCEYGPDKTRNYELGVKGDTADHVLSYDASLYYIDWKDIQLQVANPVNSFTYYTNASKAASRGLELSGQARPLQGTTVSAWIALNDATLKSSLPTDSTVYGAAGDRLPYASRVSGNLSVRRDFPLTANVSGFAQGSMSYVGDRKEIFVAPGQTRFNLPGYMQANLSAGVRYNSWVASLFVNNLTDKRGLLSMPQIGVTTFGALYIQPRTVGLSIADSF